MFYMATAATDTAARLVRDRGWGWGVGLGGWVRARLTVGIEGRGRVGAEGRIAVWVRIRAQLGFGLGLGPAARLRERGGDGARGGKVARRRLVLLQLCATLACNATRRVAASGAWGCSLSHYYTDSVLTHY